MRNFAQLFWTLLKQRLAKTDPVPVVIDAVGSVVCGAACGYIVLFSGGSVPLSCAVSVLGTLIVTIGHSIKAAVATGLTPYDPAIVQALFDHIAHLQRELAVREQVERQLWRGREDRPWEDA